MSIFDIPLPPWFGKAAADPFIAELYVIAEHAWLYRAVACPVTEPCVPCQVVRRK